MALKHYKPTTASQRGTVLVSRAGLHKGGPVKALTRGLPSKGGRNGRGRITARFRGGGHRRCYRLIDFRRNRPDQPAVVERLEYDPNRTAFVALVRYEDGTLAYILAPQRLSVGDSVVSGASVDVKPGNAMPLRAMPPGVLVHNVELKAGGGGKLARAAGSSAQLVSKDHDHVLLRLSSGETRMVHAACMATVGVVSNPDNQNIHLGKAGRSRWKGRRPHNRGVSMNPVDHPHGGGEGRTSGGRHPVTPWGKPTKGKKTRRNRTSDRWIVRDRRAGRKGRG